MSPANGRSRHDETPPHPVSLLPNFIDPDCYQDGLGYLGAEMLHVMQFENVYRGNNDIPWAWHRRIAAKEALAAVWSMTGKWKARRGADVDMGEFDQVVSREAQDLAQFLNERELDSLHGLYGRDEEAIREVFETVIDAVISVSLVKRTQQVSPMFGSKVLHHYFPVSDVSRDARVDTGLDGSQDAKGDGSFDGNQDAQAQNAIQYVDWHDGDGVSIIDPVGDSLDGYVRGGDFDHPIWASDDTSSWYLLHITEGGVPTTDYARVSLPHVTDRHGAQTKVLRFELLDDAPDTDVEQIEFLEEQSPGKAGEQDPSYPQHILVEPVFYQREWIKFSPETLERAKSVGAEAFYQIFWEMKAQPDYRLRVQLIYDDAGGLMVQAHDDVLTDANPLHVDSGPVSVGKIEMAGVDSAQGWCLLEVWLDRTRGSKSRWRVKFNGTDIVDYTGVLGNGSQNIINLPMFVQIYSDVTDLSKAPYYELIDDFELWDGPPSDAWSQ